MDAYSICVTSPSRRNSSRIYQDLRSIRLHSLADTDPGVRRQLTTMEGFLQVRPLSFDAAWSGIWGGTLPARTFKSSHFALYSLSSFERDLVGFKIHAHAYNFTRSVELETRPQTLTLPSSALVWRACVVPISSSAMASK